jgi:hypothetical protein
MSRLLRELLARRTLARAQAALLAAYRALVSAARSGPRRLGRAVRSHRAVLVALILYFGFLSLGLASLLWTWPHRPDLGQEEAQHQE